MYVNLMEVVVNGSKQAGLESILQNEGQEFNNFLHCCFAYVRVYVCVYTYIYTCEVGLCLQEEDGGYEGSGAYDRCMR